MSYICKNCGGTRRKSKRGFCSKPFCRAASLRELESERQAYKTEWMKKKRDESRKEFLINTKRCLHCGAKQVKPGTLYCRYHYEGYVKPVFKKEVYIPAGAKAVSWYQSVRQENENRAKPVVVKEPEEPVRKPKKHWWVNGVMVPIKTPPRVSGDS